MFWLFLGLMFVPVLTYMIASYDDALEPGRWAWAGVSVALFLGIGFLLGSLLAMLAAVVVTYLLMTGWKVVRD